MENAGTKPHPLWQDNDLVFSNETGKPMDAGNVLRQYFWPWLKKARPPHIRFHDRRRTAVTLLRDQGIHPKIVSEILGHGKIGIASTYTATPCLQGIMRRLLLLLRWMRYWEDMATGIRWSLCYSDDLTQQGLPHSRRLFLITIDAL